VSPVRTTLAFEVLDFAAVPASPDIAVLRLEGRFSAPSRRRLGGPRLLAENAEERLEVPAADGGEAVADPDGLHWRGSFALPLRMLLGAEFALAIGQELLDLPAPDRDEGLTGAGDLHVRLAREANALRTLADEARAAATAALGRADDERGARERLGAELGAERHAREELATRLSQFEAELGARDDTLERLRVEHAEELERRDAAARADADARVAAVEAEAAELRRALKSARADIELLRRERDRAAERTTVVRAEPAAAARLPVDRGVHPEQDAAGPALPLPEGEEVGPVRPAGAGRASANGANGANGDGPGAHDDAEPPTTIAGGAAPGSEAPTEVHPADPDTGAGAARAEDEDFDDETDWDWDDDAEGVRVLGNRPPRARTGREPPVEPLPGTAEVGARHIVPGDIGRAGLGPWLARAAAILALAFVVAAVLAVVWGMR
jgi:hypothetical protein